MQNKFPFPGKMMILFLGLTVAAVACHSNDYVDSEEDEQTFVSTSHEMTVTARDTTHALTDSTVELKKDTTSVRDSTGHGDK